MVASPGAIILLSQDLAGPLSRFGERLVPFLEDTDSILDDELQDAISTFAVEVAGVAWSHPFARTV